MKFLKLLSLFLTMLWFTFSLKSQQPELVMPIGHIQAIRGLQFSSNGKTMLTYSYDRTIKIWDTQTGTLIKTLIGHEDWISGATFNVAETKIISVDFKGVIKIWDTKTGSLLKDYNTGHDGRAYNTVFDKQKSKLFIMSNIGEVKCYNSDSGNLLYDLESDVNSRNISMKLSRDDKTLIVGSENGTAQIFDAQTGKLMVNLKGHTHEIVNIEMSSDNRYIATASYDSTAIVWNNAGEIVHRFRHIGKVNNVSFSPDNKKLLTASDEDTIVKIWDVQSGKLFKTLSHTKPIMYAVFTPISNKVLTSAEDNTAKIWDTTTDQVITFQGSKQEEFQKAGFSPDGKKLALVSYMYDGNCPVRIYDIQTGLLLSKLQGHTYYLNDLTFFKDNTISFTSSDFSYKFFDFKNGRLLKSFYGHKYYIESVEFSSDKKTLLTSSNDHTAKLWDISSGANLFTIKGDIKIRGILVDLAKYSPDGKTILTIFNDSTAKLWGANSGTLLDTLIGHKGKIHYGSFNYDGTKILTSSEDSTVKLWGTNDGSLINNFKCNVHYYYLPMAAFSHTSNKIAIIDSDSTLKIWDASSGSEIFTLNHNEKYINHVEFSNNDSVVLTITLDRINLWTTQTGKIFKTFKFKPNTLRLARFSDRSIHTITNEGFSIYDLNGELQKNINGDFNDALVDSAKNNVFLRKGSELFVFDLNSSKYLYTFVVIDSTDYLVYDSLGRYDGTEAARKLLYFTCGDEVIGLDQAKGLWVPNLAERIINGETINAPKLSDYNLCGTIPLVENVEDSTGYRFTITPRTGGLGETLLYVNDIEVKRYKPNELSKTPTGYQLFISMQSLQPYFIAGKYNPVVVKAYTKNNDIISKGAEVIQDETKTSAVIPNIYAIMVGVSDYKDTGMDLNYAAKDAKDLSEAISLSAKKLLNTDGKEHVFIYTLDTEPGRKLFPEKVAIKSVFDTISKKANANDILLIFFTGHGVVHGDKKQFYFLTADASPDSDIPSTGISMDELTDWINPGKIKAQKRLLIFDACNSGQAIDDLQALALAKDDDDAIRIKAIDKLNEKSGLYILSASSKDRSAFESGKLSQGLLTYSLLKTMKDEPGILENGKFINAGRWFQKSSEMVEDLARDLVGRQEPQMSANPNFNIGIVDSEVISKIHLEQEKPVFLPSNFRNKKTDEDDKDLGYHMNLRLSNTSNTTNNWFTFNNNSTVKIENAYTLFGSYELAGQDITVNVKIKQNSTISVFQISGKSDNIIELTDKILLKSKEYIVPKQ